MFLNLLEKRKSLNISIKILVSAATRPFFNLLGTKIMSGRNPNNHTDIAQQISDKPLGILYLHCTCMFLLSVMAQIQTSRRKVPRNWSKIPPTKERCEDGNVENIPEVSGMERYTARSCSYLKSVIKKYLKSVQLTRQEHPSTPRIQLQRQQMLQGIEHPDNVEPEPRIKA